MAKPSVYSQEILDAICEELAKGRPMTVICRELAEQGTTLAPRTVRDWANERDEDGKPTERGRHVSAALAAARELGEEALAEECLEIADDASNDWMERLDKEDRHIGWQLNGDHVQRSKLRIDTRLKLLAKFNPKRWGDKVSQEISGPGGGPVETITRVERRIVRPGSSDS